MRILTEPRTRAHGAVPRAARDRGRRAVASRTTRSREIARFARARQRHDREHRRAAAGDDPGERARRGVLRGGRDVALRGDRRRRLRAPPARAGRPQPGPLALHPLMRQEQPMTKRPLLLLVGAPGAAARLRPQGRPAAAAAADASRAHRLPLRAARRRARAAGDRPRGVGRRRRLRHGGRRVPVRDRPGRPREGAAAACPGVAPGARATTTLPLPAPGTLVRAAARGRRAGEHGPRTVTMALVAQPPVEPPRELDGGPGRGRRRPGVEGRATEGGRSRRSGRSARASRERPQRRPCPARRARPLRPQARRRPRRRRSRRPRARRCRGGRSGAGAARFRCPGRQQAHRRGSRRATPGEQKPGELKPGETRTVQAPPARRSGFFVYRRAATAATPVRSARSRSTAARSATRARGSVPRGATSCARSPRASR